MKTALKVMAFVVSVAYPFLVLFFLNRGIEPRWFSAIIIIVLLLQLGRNMSGMLIYVLIAVWLVMITALIAINSEKILRLYPILMSSAFFIVFMISLKFPPTMIEKFALMKEPFLPPNAVQYCRNVTKVWCCFFVSNITVSIATLFMPMKIWALYNGFIAYILMGILFAVEYIVRITVRSEQ